MTDYWQNWFDKLWNNRNSYFKKFEYVNSVLLLTHSIFYYELGVDLLSHYTNVLEQPSGGFQQESPIKQFVRYSGLTYRTSVKFIVLSDL